MSEDVDYCGLYKNYKEELDFIRTAHNWNDEKFWEYQKNVVGACIGSGLDPKYLLDSDIAFIKKEEKLSDADRLKLEEYEKERQALVEKDRKKEELERAKKMKKEGKPFICGTSTYEKLDKFVDHMKQSKRDWLAFAKKIARKPNVKEAAKLVVDNPQVSMMAAGLVALPAVSTIGVAMITAGAVSYYYEKVREKNQEQSQQQTLQQNQKQTRQENPQLTQQKNQEIPQEQSKNNITSDNTREAINTGQVNLTVKKDRVEER